MVYESQVGYERRLVAVSSNGTAAKLASEYVDRLKPCYEWEGYHDCPEREARFADEYQAANPDSPFNAYLPLLSAHRWLCAAEAFDFEQRPADAVRSRRQYEQSIVVALLSPTILIRTAAERLSVRGGCMSR
jgi:hypothetical protein